MVFAAELISTVIKMVVMGVFAFAGISLGKHLRKRKNEKALVKSE